MRHEFSFVAERALARHCPELLRAPPAPAELLPRLERAGTRMARALGAALAPLLDEPPAVRCQAPQAMDAAAFAAGIAPLAANSLLAGPGKSRLCLSIEAEVILRLVDRAFGGRGTAPDPLPPAFPLSAELMIARLEAIAATALAEALDLPPAALEGLARAGSLTELEPFAGNTALAVMTMAVEEIGGARWSLHIAVAEADLAALLGEARGAPPPARPSTTTRHNSPLDEPFAELPLTLSAVLVDTRISMAALAALQPGTVLPVAVARKVPVRAGGRTVAHGTVGALDDRLAVQVTECF